MTGRFIIALGLVLGGLLACSIGVTGNPGPYPVDGYESPEEAMVAIFILNIGPDLFWFSALLLLTCLVWKGGVDRVPKKTSMFVAGVILIALVVAALGALIDFTLLLREYPFGYTLYYDLLNWSMAVVLIFISVYASSILVLNISVKASILPAAAMAALNPIWWELALETEFGIESLTILISLVMVPVFLVALAIWHGRRFAKEDIPEPSALPGPPST